MPEIILKNGTSSAFNPERLRESLSKRVEPALLDGVVERVTKEMAEKGEARLEVSELGAAVGEALLEVNSELPSKSARVVANDDPIRAAQEAHAGRGLLSAIGIELPVSPPSQQRAEFYSGLREVLAEAGDLILDRNTPADAESEEEAERQKGDDSNELKLSTEAPADKGEEISTVKTVSGSLRAVSWLWDTTVPGNPFGTDGPKKVPKAWPGDTLTKCRQWHGIDISCNVKAGAFDKKSLKVSTPKYIGLTSVCGILGKAHLTDRKVTAATWGTDKGGDYVEVTALLGSRLGAFVPKLDLKRPNLLGRAKILERLSGPFAIFGGVEYLITKAIELVSDDQYLGEVSAVAKIYTRVGMRLYTSGKTYSGFESKVGGNGFQTTDEIFEDDIGYSFMPEHHVYVGGHYLLGVTPKSLDGYPETVKWIDSWRPYDVMAFFLLSQAIEDWCKNTPLAEKKAVAAEFKKRYPKVFAGTKFK